MSEKGIGLSQKQHFVARFTALTFVLVGMQSAVLYAQETNPLLSFDEKAIELWIETKKADDPKGFDQPRCLRSDAFADDVGTSCLAQQAIFFLTEVNRRRMIEQKALRRTLKVTDERRFAAAARAEKAEETLNEAQVALAKVEALTLRLKVLEKQVATENEIAKDLRVTNTLLIDAYKSLTNQLRQGLVDTLPDVGN